MSLFGDLSKYSCWDDRMINDTSFNRCGDNGRCLPNSKNLSQYICVCDPMYDLTTFCSKHYLQNDHYLAWFVIVAAVSFSLFTITFLLYVLELACDIKSVGVNYLKTSNGFAKISSIIFHVLKLISIIFLTMNINYRVADWELFHYLLHFIAIVAIVVQFLVAGINWIDILLLAKRLGDRNQVFNIIRKVIIVMLSIGVPVIFINAILSNLNIAYGITNKITAFGSLVVIIPGCLIIFIFGIICMIWLHKLQNKSQRIKQNQKRTVYMISVSVVFILNFSIMMLIQFNKVGEAYLLNLYVSSTLQIISQVLLWLAMENHTWHKGKCWQHYKFIWLNGEKVLETSSTQEKQTSSTHEKQSSVNKTSHECNTSSSVVVQISARHSDSLDDGVEMLENAKMLENVVH